MASLKLTLSTLFLSVFISSCGPGDLLEYPKTHKFKIFVDNKSDQSVLLKFEAYYDGYCKKGFVKESIPATTRKKITVVFDSCRNGGGETISRAVYQFNPQDESSVQYHLSGELKDEARITCENQKCTMTD